MIRDKDDDALAKLLRLAGSPPPVAADRTQRVRQAVERAWEDRVDERRRRRRQFGAFLVPALAALLIVVIRLPWREDAKPAGPVGRWLSTGEVVNAGDLLETGAGLRSTVRLDSGTSLRVDRESTLRVVSSRDVELLRGAIYLDDGSDRGQAIEIRTALGVVRDIGTQFEVRLTDARLRVRVRSGIVSVSDGRETVSGGAGAELTSGSGRIVRGQAPVYGADWDWVAAAAPPFEIEGRTLAAFLAHLTREHGWSLRFSSPLVERTAADTVLHGSIEGLSAEDSLATVVPAAGLSYVLRDGVLTLTATGKRP